MRIGVTGQIGTGKSTFAGYFEDFGAKVISADMVGKIVVENNASLLMKLAKAFGPEILTPSGKLRRKKLGQLAFANEKAMKRLNRLVHPHLLRELERQVRKVEKKIDLVVIDAALLIDWSWHKRVDLTILVHAGKELKIRRLRARGYSRSEALMRLKSQMKYSQLRCHSDIVVFNNKDKKYLKKRVCEIVQKISRK